MPDRPAYFEIEALLLTVPAGEYPIVPEAWLKWDDEHWLAPLGTAHPPFGTVEQVTLNTAALRGMH